MTTTIPIKQLENCHIFFNQTTHIATLQWLYPASTAIIHFAILKSANLPFITSADDPPIQLQWYSNTNPIALSQAKPHTIARQLIPFMKTLDTTYKSHIFAFSIEDILSLTNNVVLFTNPLHITKNNEPICFPISFAENPELEKCIPPFITTKENGFFAIAQILNYEAIDEPYYHSIWWRNFINSAIAPTHKRLFIL